jgi:putative transposase
MVTLTKTAANQYFVSFSCEEKIGLKAKTGKEIGIDVGIKDVIVTSDNYRYQRQAIKVARIHEKIANCRRDFDIVTSCDKITSNFTNYTLLQRG